MRRADRLFQIVSMLRRRRLTTAAQLAERLEVSERTIYRDVADLVRSGVPIEGEAGVGYRLGKEFDLPPLMFDPHEIQALVLGARMVEAWADDELRSAARRALDKVEHALPAARLHMVGDTALFSLSFHVPPEQRALVGVVRRAIEQRRKLAFAYLDAEGRATRRVVRPLGLYFWGSTWTPACWCDLRQDHRSFRVDRMDAPALLDEAFELVSPVTLDDFVTAIRARDG